MRYVHPVRIRVRIAVTPGEAEVSTRSSLLPLPYQAYAAHLRTETQGAPNEMGPQSHQASSRMDKLGLLLKILRNRDTPRLKPKAQQQGTGLLNSGSHTQGGSGSAASSPYQARAAPLRDLVGLELPPRHVTDFLINTYFKSVHWFMMVLEEPSFRQNYERIISSGVACQSELPFVTLLMMVLAIASRYARMKDIRDCCPDFDMDSLQTLLLGKVKQHIYDLFDDACLEVVQVTILLGSFYLYNAKPNLAFAILGAGIKCAQAMGLHLESSWKTESENVREMQRRTWWELFVFDRFASIVFGKPCSIRASDCKVEVSAVLNCFSPQHPDYQSTEITEEGKMVPVTLYTYQRLKSRLYKIMSPVLENMHFLGPAQNRVQLSDNINKTHQQLVEWHASLPEELLLSRISSNTNISSGAVQSTFKMQALALQLAYDNIMVILHRPLLLSEPEDPSVPHAENGRVGTSSSEPRTTPALQKANATSRNQCWESAMRTSSIIQHLDVLRQMKATHAASYTGMHLFTAGVMLSVVAMSQPVSRKAQEAKRAIGSIIRLLKAFGPHTVLSAQGGTIMERLLLLIMTKEMTALISDSQHSQLNDMILGSRQPSPFPYSIRAHVQSPRSNNEIVASTPSNEPQGLEYCQPDSGSLLVPDSQTSDPFEFTDFNMGMLSVQEAFRSAPVFGSGSEGDATIRAPVGEGDPATSLERDEQSIQVATNGAGDFVSMYGNSLGGLHDNGQMWLWDVPSKPF
ncbi:hypothetical protein FVEG_04336 [Fusarium verticillioides 7600]|uniref:Xylanolytic transcriptional activator regulatory domain-containing protein n=1 Tax=Gibberella moniliformis (strain M3125 / FGSC 7600) TaxID=334819 RepID=W7M4S9_GIBM7|nr:hypothetical protein FVEG_04336 [Fusarium verticillioides 7600]EWG42570.1 hypothetical protein FVEG_04336 [Fusarium verticillioides 7600]